MLQQIQDFKLGRAHLKKLHRAEGGAKNHDFTPQNLIFFQRATTPPLWISYLTQCSTMQKCIVIVHRVKHANDELISQRNH
jgi:hypothetical protein